MGGAKTTGEFKGPPSLLMTFLENCRGIIFSLGESTIMKSMTGLVAFALDSMGASQELIPSSEQVCRSLVTSAATMIVYFSVFGYRHWRLRRRLFEELRKAKLQLQSENQVKSQSKEIRIFVDGAFDLMHFGHMNAFRLARSLGTHLVVGINSDQSITECKGAPLMNDEERLTMVQACKFVDEVVPDCPYIMNQEYLDWVIREHKIDYVVHGDDPCIVDGKDVYATAKASGKFRTIPRTEGVSTTDIVGRILLWAQGGKQNGSSGGSGSLGSRSKFLTTSGLLHLFSANDHTIGNSSTRGLRIIYVAGMWDLFHPGHVAMLKAAKQRGDYLIVGVHGDGAVNHLNDRNLPLMNIHERVLSVLGCCFVDEVLIDAPCHVTPEMISSLNLSEVIGWEEDDTIDSLGDQQGDRYAHAKHAGVFTRLPRPGTFRLEKIVERIHKNQQSYQAKFERKMKAETQFYQAKYSGGLSSSE